MSNQQPSEQQLGDTASVGMNGNGSQPPLRKNEQPTIPKSVKVEPLKQPPVHKATGPRTTQGKQRSKLNALRDGLFSKAVVLKDESRAQYESLLTGIIEDLQPQGKLETVLVETIATLLWRKRRFIQVENAEISKLAFSMRSNSLVAIGIQRLDYARLEAAPYKADEKHSNLALVQAAMECLTKIQHCIYSDSLGAEEKEGIRRMLFGDDQEPAERARSIRECLEVSRLTAMFPGAKERSGDPEQLKQLMGEAVEAEVKRLANLYNSLVAVEFKKTEANIRAARIPSQESSDRLLRYESHLSREFDRTMAQLERLQRMRKGLPVPPPIKVEIAS